MAGLIVHEWVERAGGAEKVVEQFATAFPDAPIHVLWDDAPSRFGKVTSESILGRTPLRRHKALALPLMPVVWRYILDAQSADWLLISSHLFAHHASAPGQRSLPKFVYSHTPARYIWEPALDTRGGGIAARAASMVLKPLDRKRAQEATSIAANSMFTRERIRRAWGRDAEVIYPPVDTDRIISAGIWSNHLSGRDAGVLETLPSHFVLAASRFVPYKNLDSAIELAESVGIPLVLAGQGPDEARLRALAEAAGVPVHFVISPSDSLLFAMYQAAMVYVFPAVEDFGIMPIEAMAAGTPVIVPAVGGAIEGVRRFQGGASILMNSKEGYREAFESAIRVDREGLPARVAEFSNSSFRQRISAWVQGRIEEGVRE